MADVTYDIFNFAAGLDQSVDEHLLKPNASPSMYNFDVRNGTLRTIAVSDIFGAVPSLSDPIATLMVYHLDDGTGILFAATTANKLYQYHENTKTWSLEAEGFANPYFSYINEKIGVTSNLVFSNGVDPVKRWNGTTLSDLSPNAPKMAFIDLHYRRLWGTGNKDFPHTVFHSAEKALDDWDFSDTQKADAVDITSGDGGRCLALITLFDQIVLFKNLGVYSIYGTFPGEYGQQLVCKCPGVIAPRSIAIAGKKVFFLTSEGLHVFDGTVATPIGMKFKEIFDSWATNDGRNDFDGESNTYGDDFRAKVCGFFHDGVYYLSNPIAGQVIELDVDRGVFWVRNKTVYSFAVVDDVLVYGDNTGCIRHYHGTTSTCENAEWNTPETTVVQGYGPTSIKRSLKLYMMAQGVGNLKFEFEFDGVTKSVVVPLTPAPTVHKVRTKNKGRKFKFRIKNEDGSQFEIMSLSVLMDADTD